MRAHAAQAIANETRDKLNAEARSDPQGLEAELNVKLADAEKTIAATKQAALATCAASPSRRPPRSSSG